MPANLLQAKSLNIGYDKQPVYRNLSFEINEGDFACIVGHNGSGKTTLIMTILGLLAPVSGILKVNLDRTKIGYMPQSSRIAPDFPATVYEVIASGALANHREKSQIEQILSEFNLKKLAKAKFSELSGGQKQRVLLARAVVAAEKLLILDEPYNNLDSGSRDKLFQILRKLHRDGLTILMITHDFSHISELANKTIELSCESGEDHHV